MSKTREVPLSELKTSFFVRKRLNDDWVLQLAALYEAGEPLPPLEITWDNEVIDGRHRKAALELLGRTVVMCHEAGQMEQGKAIVSALKANVGGSLPPTKEDIVHSMIQLLNQGWTQRKILDSMPFPRSVASKYLKDAWGVVLDSKLKAAMKDVAENDMKVKDAAEKHGVPLEKLQEHMNPNRKKRKQQSMAHLKNQLQRAYQGFHRQIAYKIQKTIETYEDNSIGEVEVFDMFDTLCDLIDKGHKRVEEHKQRFVKLAEEREKLSKIAI